MKRRRFVLSAAAALPLAGCGAGEGPSDGEEATETGTPADTPSEDGAGASTPTDDGSGDDDAGEGTTEGQGGETTEDGGVELGDVMRFESSYAMEITLTDTENGQKRVITARYHDSDSYTRMEADGRTVESYSVDGDAYTVFPDEGRCLKNAGGGQGQAPNQRSQVDPERYESGAEANPEIRAAGRTTVDGEEMYVFVLPADEAADYDEDVTYYVSVETGYLRRVEFADGVVDYHSWGEVDPIEPPEMECESY